MNSVETYDLTKVYSTHFGKRKVHALSNLNLNVPRGTIFGLLGPNGAGKTTLIKMLLGITFPTQGSARILNVPISDFLIKKKVGYLPENHKYPPYLSGGDVLKYFGSLSGVESESLNKKIDFLLELVNLTKWKKTKVKAYSKGMMQRLGLAQALINDPELIFLDEPTDGVDPIGRKEIRNILLELKSRSKTIFLNSHLLSEVELITDRVGILNRGKLIREGTVSELTENKEEFILKVDNESIDEILNQDKINFIKKNDVYIIKVSDVNELNKIIDALRNNSIIIKEIIQQKNTLEEMFISLINESEKEIN